MTTMFSWVWLVEAVGGDYSSVCDLTLYDSTKILTETGTGTSTNFLTLTETKTGNNLGSFMSMHIQ